VNGKKKSVFLQMGIQIIEENRLTNYKLAADTIQLAILQKLSLSLHLDIQRKTT